MLGLVISPLVLIVLIWPFGPPGVRMAVAVAAVAYFASNAAMRRESDAETLSVWDNVWAGVGIVSVALTVGGSLVAFILGPS